MPSCLSQSGMLHIGAGWLFHLPRVNVMLLLPSRLCTPHHYPFSSRPSTSLPPSSGNTKSEAMVRAEEEDEELPPDRTVMKKDVLRLRVRGGRGGDGIARYNGVGGFGGSVYLRPVPRLDFKRFFDSFQLDRCVRAENGENAAQVKLVGRNAPNAIIDVPMGVECVDKEERLLARCTEPKRRYLIARGGVAGYADNKYIGQKGEDLSVDVHLKLRPNVGFLGFPNAGKSTLLKSLVPQKRVKIADYPFTTLDPQMCYMKYEGEEANNRDFEEQRRERSKKGRVRQPAPFTLSIADLPGIIEGAHMNRGMGCKFLKHLEYSDIIAMVVDVHGFQYAMQPGDPNKSALETIGLLNREVELYGRDLLAKPFILLLNKIDLDGGREKALELKQLLSPLPTEDDTPEIKAKSRPGRKRKGGERWAKELAEQFRPQEPIHFEEVMEISAKTGELGNLREVLKDVHRRLHPLEHVVFDEERLMTVDGEGGENKKILVYYECARLLSSHSHHLIRVHL